MRIVPPPLPLTSISSGLIGSARMVPCRGGVDRPHPEPGLCPAPATEARLTVPPSAAMNPDGPPTMIDVAADQRQRLAGL